MDSIKFFTPELPMSPKLICPACDAGFTLAKDTRGQNAFCPSCGKALVVNAIGMAILDDLPSSAPAQKWNPWPLVSVAAVVLLCGGVVAYFATRHPAEEPKQVAKNDSVPPPPPPTTEPTKIEPPIVPPASHPAKPDTTPHANKQTKPQIQPSELQNPEPNPNPNPKPEPKKPDPVPTPKPAEPFLGGAFLALSKDGKTLASGNGGEVRLWDVAEGKVIRTIQAPKDTGFTSLAWSPDGKTLATGTNRSGKENPIVLWNVADGQFIRTLNPITATESITTTPARGSFIGPGVSWMPLSMPTGPAQSVTFTPDGKTVASAGDGMIHLYNTASGKNTAALGYNTPIANLPALPGLGVYCALYTPDGKRMISGGTDGVLRWWDMTTGRNIASDPTSLNPVTLQVALSKDGKALASWVSGGKEVRVWGAIDRKSIGTFITDSVVYSVAISPDGKTVASGGGLWDAKQNIAELKLWDISTGKITVVMEAKDFAINSVAFSADGKTLYSQRAEDIKEWDAASSKLIRTLGR
jgi:WD40 repeat protein